MAEIFRSESEKTPDPFFDPHMNMESREAANASGDIGQFFGALQIDLFIVTRSVTNHTCAPNNVKSFSFFP